MILLSSFLVKVVSRSVDAWWNSETIAIANSRA